MEERGNVRELESKNIKALLWKYFLPAFVGVISSSLYNIVDRIFIGQGVGAYALAGLATVFPIMLIIMAFGMLLGIGTGVRISITFGKKDFENAEKTLNNSLVLMIIVSIVLTVLGLIFKTQLLGLFGTGIETHEYADDYLEIILIGTLFSVVGYSLNNVIRSEGNARIAMYSMIITAGLNAILDPIFIFTFDLGVKGAAYATIISQFVLMAWVLRHFLSKRSLIKIKPKYFRIETKILLSIVSIGFAPFAMQLAGSFVQGLLNKQLIVFGGDLAVGAMGIFMSVATLIIMIIVAINMAAQPILGFNYGAKNYIRVKETLFLCLKAATFAAIFFFVVVQAFPAAVVKSFNTSNAELTNISVPGIRIFMAALPLVGFQVIMGNYFQSIGKAGIAALLSLLRQVIVLIPLIFILPNFWGLQGVWIANPVSDAISAMIVFTFFLKEKKKLQVLVNEQAIKTR